MTFSGEAMIDEIRAALVRLRETHHDPYVTARVNEILKHVEELEVQISNPDRPADAGLSSRVLSRGPDCDIFEHGLSSFGTMD